MKYDKQKINREKINKMRKIISDPKNNIDAFLLTSRENIFWFINQNYSAGWIIITEQENYLLIDGRYYQISLDSQLINITDIIKVSSYEKGLCIFLANKLKIQRIGFESDSVTYLKVLKWGENNPNHKFIPVNTSFLRSIKTKNEIRDIAGAAKIGDIAFGKTIELIKKGMTEIDVAKILENQFLLAGSDGPSFPTIVASGPNAAYPHHKTGNRVLQNNEMVVIDSGCKYKNYCSDMTRTIFIGKPSKENLKIYNIVREAQILGVKSIKPGITFDSIDRITRNYISSARYGQYFIHGTGHGLGINVHEQPYVTINNNDTLKANNVITVEPGIYIPGKCGVRIEDDIVVTEDGYKILNSTTIEPIIIKF